MRPPDDLLTRLVPPQQGDPLVLGLRNLYIVPSRFGWLWLSGGALLLIVAIQTQRNGPLLLSYLMLGLMLLALHLTHFNLQGLELRCGEPRPGFAGSTVRYPLIARSRQRREGLQLSWQAGGEPLGVTLLPGEQTLELPWNPPRRGWQRPGRLRLVSTAPLGLFRCWSRWEPPRAQLIYPARRRGPVAQVPLEQPRRSAGDGRRGSGRAVSSGVICGPTARRTAAPGWRGNPWPRPGPAHQAVRRRGGGAAAAGAGTGAALGGGLEHLSARIWQLAPQEERYGLRLPDGVIPPGSGPAHRDACLRALATAPGEAHGNG